MPRTKGLIKTETLEATRTLRGELEALPEALPAPLNDTGRPSKMTADTLKKLEAAFSYGCPDDEACAYAGISTTTLYNYQKENPHFREIKQALRKMPTIKARTAVVKSFKEKPELAMRYLEATLPDEFKTKSTVKHEVEVEVNFSHELRERTKKYEPEPIDAVAVEVSPSDVDGMES